MTDDAEIPDPSRAREPAKKAAETDAQHQGRSDARRSARAPHHPGPWLSYMAPRPGRDRHANQMSFVEFYNAVYGHGRGPRAQPIPRCWSRHPDLVAEIGTLAATWRSANTGPSATPEGAQNWHERWRPGFVARMREAMHPKCLDGEHHERNATPVPDRFAVPQPRRGSNPQQGTGEGPWEEHMDGTQTPPAGGQDNQQ